MSAYSANKDSTDQNKPVNDKLLKHLHDAFRKSALPQEMQDFDESQSIEAARFSLQCAQVRHKGNSVICIESLSRHNGQRILRIAIVNDDMPFLVDSVCASIAAMGIAIERIIHPVMSAERDENGNLTSISAKNGDKDFLNP